MSYTVSEKTSKAKGRVAEGQDTVTFAHRYIQEFKTDEKGNVLEDEKGNPIPTGNWNPNSPAEAFSHYMELFPKNDQKAIDDILFLINRRFYFDDQPGADPVDRAARKLAKDLGVPVEDVMALLSGLKK